MAAKFRKVDPRIWHDEAFVGLDTTHKLIAMYCLTSSQTNRIGIFHLSPGMASEQLGMKLDTYRKGIRYVCDTLGWGIDEVSNVIYMRTWWKYNGDIGPKRLKGAMADLHDLPQTQLVQKFLANRAYLSKSESAILDTYAIGIGGVCPVAAQEQEQEQEQKQKQKQKEIPPISPPGGNSRFVRPSLADVTEYCQERQNKIEPQAFLDYYTANGWKVGRNAMKDWKAAIRSWETRQKEQHQIEMGF